MLKVIKINYSLSEPYRDGTYIDPISFFKAFLNCKKNKKSIPIWASIDINDLNEEKSLAELKEIHYHSNELFGLITMYDKRETLLKAIDKNFMIITPIFFNKNDFIKLIGFYMSYRK